MKTVKKYSAALLTLAALFGVVLFTTHASETLPDSPEGLFISDYWLVGSERSGLTSYDYTFKAQVTNNGPDAKNVRAELVGWQNSVTVIEGELSFGDISVGEAAMSEDAFTIRVNRTIPFSEWELVFHFTTDADEPEPAGMFNWVNTWPGQQGSLADPIYAITARQFQSGDGNEVVKVDFSTFNSSSYIQTYFRADVQESGNPAITAADMRFVDNPTTGAVAPIDGTWNSGVFFNDAVLSSTYIGNVNYGNVSIVLSFNFNTFESEWEHRIAKWGSNGTVTTYQKINGMDTSSNAATHKLIASSGGALMLGYTTIDGHALVREVNPDTLVLGATLIDLPEVTFADLIYDNAENYIAVGRMLSATLNATVGVAFGKKGGVDFFYEIPEIPGMRSFTINYIIRDAADGNLIVVGTGIRNDDSRNHVFVAKTTSPTFVDFNWPPSEIEGWSQQFGPNNTASSDSNWAPYKVPDNAYVFYGWNDPRIFADRNIEGYNYVPTNSASPDFSVLAEGEWSSWVLDLSSLGYGTFYYVVIVPADNSPVPVVNVTIVRPAGSWMVGDPISFSVRLRNTEDFAITAPAALGCIKNADLTATCTPTEVGTYDISVSAAADPSVIDTLTVTVVKRVALSILPSSVSLEIGETQTFTVTKENTADFVLEDLPGMGCVKIDSSTVECTPTFWVAGRTRNVVVMANDYRSKTASASITVDALEDLPENFSITRGTGTTAATFNMIYVESGTYTRGRNARDDDEERGLPAPDQYETPAHEVTLSSYWILDREVTGGMRRAIDGTSTYAATTPLSNINWFDANAVACRLSTDTGRPFRLLSDAEWEFAARGGNVGKNDDFVYSGSNIASEVATYSGRGSLSAPTATGTSARKANQLGIWDMSGNAFEWVYDWIESYTSTPKVDPVSAFGMGNKTRRGGSTDEPAIYARVSRRAIRSREGGAGMGFRLGYGPLPPGMQTPCDAAASGYSQTIPEGDEFRDSRLVVSNDMVWVSSTTAADGSSIMGSNVLIARGDGAGALGSSRGSWFTVNDRVLYIVTANGAATSYPYYLFNLNEMTVITDPNGGLPTRFYRVPTYLLPNDPDEPVATGASLAELVALVPPENVLTREQLENPDTNIRDPRLIIGPDDQGRERRWFFDGNCCGGNHKYRFELRADGTAEFVVMDYNNGGTNGQSFDENVLATTGTSGYWFTTGNVGLHLYFPGTGSNRYFNYMYTVGERTSGTTASHMPPGPVHTHVSFQEYERGDFRIFNGIIRRFTTEARTPLQEKEVAGTSGTTNCTSGGTTARCNALVVPGSGIYNYEFQDTAWPYGYIVRPYSSMSGTSGNPVYTPDAYKWRSGQ